MFGREKTWFQIHFWVVFHKRNWLSPLKRRNKREINEKKTKKKWQTGRRCKKEVQWMTLVTVSTKILFKTFVSNKYFLTV